MLKPHILESIGGLLLAAQSIAATCAAAVALSLAAAPAHARIIGHQVTQSGHHIEFSDHPCSQIPAHFDESGQLRSMDGYEAVVENAKGGIDNLGCAQSREGVTAVTWIDAGEQEFFFARDMKLGE